MIEVNLFRALLDSIILLIDHPKFFDLGPGMPVFTEMYVCVVCVCARAKGLSV